MAAQVAAGGPVEPAGATRVPEAGTWTGTAPVTAPAAPSEPVRRERTGPDDGEDDGERTAPATADGSNHHNGLKKQYRRRVVRPNRTPQQRRAL
jgi:hypothetical protein